MKEADQDRDRQFVEHLRVGDAEASRHFVREQYPAVYRYLLYQTASRDLAEDLTQETFLQAWRHLDTFSGRGSLKAWLLAIARREFLQALRRRRETASLDQIAEVPASEAAWTDAVERREEDSSMERREFLRQTAAGAMGMMLPEREVVDDRLTRKVTLARE